jgi:elongin-A
MLAKWEQNTPQIRGETGDIWLRLIKRDIPNWRNKPHEPTNPESWWKVYKKLKREADLEERKAEQMLKDKMSDIKKEENTWKVAPPTQAIPEKKGRNKGTAMQFQRGSDNNGLRFTTGSKTKDFFQSVRRQAAESHLQKKGVLSRPTNMLNNGVAAKRIMQAPQHMVEDRQRQVEHGRQISQRASDAREPEVEAPRTSLAARAAHDLKVREDRLKAVREGRPVSTPLPAPSPAKPTSTATRTGFMGMKAPSTSAAFETPKGSSSTARPTANSSSKTASVSVRQLSHAPKISTSTMRPASSATKLVTDPSKSSAQASKERPKPSTAPASATKDLDSHFDESIPIPSVERYIPPGKEDNPHCIPGYRSQGPLKPRRTPTPPKSKTPTILLERKKSPSKAHSHSTNRRAITPSVALRPAPPTAAASRLGMKRKPGPTILLPMKRAKR